ncbi:hypothetical protein [Candidatus Hodarchaeum mangrovi]
MDFIKKIKEKAIFESSVIKTTELTSIKKFNSQQKTHEFSLTT